MVRRGSIAYRIVAGCGLVLIRAFEWTIRRHTGERVFYEPREFPWMARIEAAWTDVRLELEQVLAAPRALPSFESISEEQGRIDQPERWKTFFVHAYGNSVEEGCAACPKAAALLDAIAGMTTAMLSIIT